MPQVTVNNRIYTVEPNTCLSQVLEDVSHPCGGKGVCGKCRVRVRGEISPLSSEEQRHLTSLELADGVRLACCTLVQGDCVVELFGGDPVICADGNTVWSSMRPDFAGFGAVVDVGTTTLAARLYSSDGVLLAQSGAPNPQAVFGADVLSRVERSLAGEGERVTDSVRQGVRHLLTRLLTFANLSLADLEELVITGNTVMLTLLTGGDPRPFATAPFVGYDSFGRAVSAPLVGIEAPFAGRVYLAPCSAAFIGGDIATALLAAALPNNALLLDIGTNGEMVLKTEKALFACSTAAGPAFEGVGISCGMVASEGAIDRVDLVNGRMYPHVIGGGKATGICGSGLVDALACLSLLGEGESSVALTPEITLGVEDLQALLVSKSALRSGVDTLLYTAGLTPQDVTQMVIAGGFGRYLNTHNALRIGLLPPVAEQRIRVVGNAALDGGAQLLLDPRLREKLARDATMMQVVELAGNPYFATRFMQNMTLEVPR